MPDKMPLVSVMIPTYNQLKFFSKAMESAASQDYPNLEIIVCDNSTNEDTAEWMSQYKHDKRVKYVRNREAMTKADNFRPFEHLAQGEYLQWLMHDDILLPGKITRMAAILSRREDITVVTSQRAVINEHGFVTESKYKMNLPIQDAVYGIFSGQEFGSIMLRTSCNAIGEPSAVLFRRNDLTNHYWQAESRGYVVISDVAMWLELMEKGDVAVFKEPLSCYRRHAAQEGQQPDVLLLSRIEWYELIEDYYKRNVFIHNPWERLPIYKHFIEESKHEAITLKKSATHEMCKRYDEIIRSMKKKIELETLWERVEGDDSRKLRS